MRAGQIQLLSCGPHLIKRTLTHLISRTTIESEGTCGRCSDCTLVATSAAAAAVDGDDDRQASDGETREEGGVKSVTTAFVSFVVGVCSSCAS